MSTVNFDESARRNAETLLELAFAEDLGSACPHLHAPDPSSRVAFDLGPAAPAPGDLTSRLTIPRDAMGSVRFVARGSGIAAGLPILPLAARRFGVDQIEAVTRDGLRIEAGEVIAHAAGSMRQLLALERTALNFLQRLSGISTLTRRHVDEVRGTNAIILDTRKTTPGWRALEKYAVRCGGGRNHRIGLYDAVLIKDNHLAWLEQGGVSDPIRHAVRSARSHPGVLVEVEVDDLDQLDVALASGPDVILVDNLGPDALSEAVRRRDASAPTVLLEASGGVSLATVGALARSGVDRISVGALTHSAPALDIGLDYDV